MLLNVFYLFLNVYSANKTITSTTKIKNVKLNQMSSVYLDDLTADVTFVCGPDDCENLENVPAHKLLLALHSPVFKTMFFGSLPEKLEVRFKDATADGLKEFLQYFYMDELYFTNENISEVINLAKKYEVDECLDLCEAEIIRNHEEFFESEGFVGCSSQAFRTILELDGLKMYGDDIFLGCFRWARNTWKHLNGDENEPTLSDIRNQLGNIFDLIELGSMRAHSISSVLSEIIDFFTKEDLIAISSILAMKYLMACDKNNQFICDLQHSCISSIEKNVISKTEVTEFQSNKRIFLVGLKYAMIFKEANSNPLSACLMLVKKSLKNTEKGTVLKRTEITCNNMYSLEHYIENNIETTSEVDFREDPRRIVIEPDIKYEFRVEIENFTPGQNFTAPLIARSNKCSQWDQSLTTLIIHRHGIISCLHFQIDKDSM